MASGSVSISTEKLKCSVCQTWPLGDVYLCPEGHLICDQCYAKKTSERCRTCKTKYPDTPGRIPSFLKEQLDEMVVFECRYKAGSDQGCQERMKRGEKERHEQGCGFRSDSVCSLLGLACGEPQNCLKVECYNWEATRQRFKETPQVAATKSGHVNIQLMDFPATEEPNRMTWRPAVIKFHPRTTTNSSFVYAVFLAQFEPADQSLYMKVLHVGDLDLHPASDFRVKISFPTVPVPSSINPMVPDVYVDISGNVTPMSCLEPNKEAQLRCSVATLQRECPLLGGTITIGLEIICPPQAPLRDATTQNNSSILDAALRKITPAGGHVSPRNHDGNNGSPCLFASPIELTPCYSQDAVANPSPGSYLMSPPGPVPKRPRTSPPQPSNNDGDGDEETREESVRASSTTGSSASGNGGSHSPSYPRPPTPGNPNNRTTNYDF